MINNILKVRVKTYNSDKSGCQRKPSQYIIGLSVEYLEILWHKHEKRITEKCRRLLPEKLRMMIEARG